MNGSTMLLAGFIVGAVGASVVWAVIIAGRKKALAGQARERGEVMSGIAELLAQADALQASFRCGTVKRERFAREMSDKVGAISSLIRHNIHKLEVFFVKYAEQQVEEYLRLIENPERRRGAQGALPQYEDDDGDTAVDDVAEEPVDASPRKTISLSKTDILPALIGGSGHPRGVSMDDPVPASPALTDNDTVETDEGDDDMSDVTVLDRPSRAATAADDDAFAVPAVPAETAGLDEQSEPRAPSDADAFEVPAADAQPADAAIDAVVEPVAVAEEERSDTDAWTEKTDDEYAAEFEQFEGLGVEPAAEQPPQVSGAEPQVSQVVTDASPVIEEITLDQMEDVAVEDMPIEEDTAGQFTVALTLETLSGGDSDESTADTGEVAELVDEDGDDVLDIAEVAVGDAAVAAPPVGPTYARAPIQDADPIPAPVPAPEPEPEPEPAAAGITGDDVGDAIDNLFRLK